jgi:cell division protein FtsL
LVLAVVGLNAMLVDVAYRATEVQERVRALDEVHDELDIEVARLSSPSRIAAWADVVGMVVPGPGESVILRVPGDREASPARREGAG